MIFLFAPALVGVAVILIITLRDQFAHRRPIPMLDQIQSELAKRRVAAKADRIFEVDIVLANLVRRRMLPEVESPTTSRRTIGFRATEPTPHQPGKREEIFSNR